MEGLSRVQQMFGGASRTVDALGRTWGQTCEHENRPPQRSFSQLGGLSLKQSFMAAAAGTGL